MRTRLVVYILLAAFVTGCSLNFKLPVAQGAQADDSRKDAITLSREAYDLISKNEYDAAIQKAELAIRKDPNNGEAQKNLALAYCESGRMEEALGPAQKSVQLSPLLDKTHFVLGKVLFKLGRLTEAVPEFQQAIRINPKYDKAYFLLGTAYDLLDKPEDARAALDQAVQLQPDYSGYYRYRDAVAAYAKQKTQTTLPKVALVKDQTNEYAAMIYGGIFYQAVVHHDFDLIEKAAGAARASKEQLPGGVWKLQTIYDSVSSPYLYTSDYEWNQHLDLLRQWTKEKPNSVTAKIALATCYVSFAWKARGHDYASKVSEQNWQLFRERLHQARNILSSAYSEPLCPMWYSLMQEIALGQAWDRESYDKLFAEAIHHEPAWYDFYTRRAIYLLPQWEGEPGELEAYVNSFAESRDRADGAILYFLVSECAGVGSLAERHKPAAHYDVLKRGFLDMRKTFGVTILDMNWMSTRALMADDRAFAKELFKELKGNIDTQLWTGKQAFDAAREFMEAK